MKKSYNIPVKRFYMLRHAESEANAARIYSGMMDTPLTDLGKEQAETAAEVIAGLEIKPNIIIHSHLQRTKETAQPTADTLKLNMVEMEEWAEQDMGEWQGVEHDEVRHLREEGIDPPSGEANEDFKNRIIYALTTTLKKYKIPLIVCHGGCFRAFSENYGLQIRGVKNCVLHEFEPSADKYKHFPWEVYTYPGKTEEE